MKLKGSKKKLTISLALFIGALAVFATAMYFFISTLLNKSGMSNIYAVCVPLIICYFALMIASVILNMSYRKNSIKAGALSTVIFVISGFMLLGPFGVLLVLGAYFTAGKQPVSLKLKDENGNEYNLSPTFAGSSEYRDQNGCLWTTRDGGNSFECEVINVKNADGTEVNLKRSYKDAFKEYYKDENGEEWTSSDGGKTFDKK